MSEHRHAYHLAHFQSADGPVTLTLPHDYRKVIADWSTLRSCMVRRVPDTFTRDEWAYLVTFLDSENLLRPFRSTFGEARDTRPESGGLVFRPRGPIAVWLPNNVSLLGPLTLVLLSLTGQRLRLKLGSSAGDLCGAFLRYAIDNLPEGILRTYLANEVSAETFSREDPRQKELAAEAAVRIVFGSDEAAAAIHTLPHPPSSVGISFTDHQSEAWLEPGALNDDTLVTLIKVFAVYGQAGCTSPRRAVMIGGTPDDALQLRDRLAELWPRVITADPPMHIASANVLAEQWSRALGWQPRLAPRNAALFACGPVELTPFEATMGLQITHASREEAVAALPANIQTIGHVLSNPADPAWLDCLARSRILRFVPLERMHHFGHIWDGHEFWRQCFAALEVST